MEGAGQIGAVLLIKDGATGRPQHRRTNLVYATVQSTLYTVHMYICTLTDT